MQQRNLNRWPDPIVKYEPHAAQEDSLPHCPNGSRLMDGRSWWPAHPDLLPVAKDDVADKNRQLVTDEAMVFGALTMGRNVIRGGVYRKVSVYDVLAVTVQRLGVCATDSCDSVVAVDTTRPSMPITFCANDSATNGGSDAEGDSGTSPAGCLTTNVPLITQVGPDGVERPVEIANSELLTLGRGMLGSPGWFEHAATPFHLGGQLSLHGPTLSAPTSTNTRLISIQDGQEVVKWDLNGTVLADPVEARSGSLVASSTSTPFLAHLATLLCAGSLRSFLVSPSVCNGIRPWGRVRRMSGSEEINGNIMDADVWAGAGKVEWTVTPTSLTPTAADDALASRPALPYMRPAWKVDEVPFDTVLAGTSLTPVRVTPRTLIGRSSREVNPSSAVEAKLAGSLFQRQLVLPAAVVAGHGKPVSRLSSHLDLDAVAAVSNLADQSGASIELNQELDRISHGYDRRIFGEKHPAPPVSLSDFILAIMMIVPELGALLGILLTTELWSRATLLGFSTIVVLGAVSMSGVVALASQEAMGAMWRARSTRTATHAIFSAGEPLNKWGFPSRAGAFVVVEKSFLLLAPTMYKPASVRLVAAAVCGGYVVAAAAMSMRVFFIVRQQQRARRVDVASLPPGAVRVLQLRARRWWRPRARDGARREGGGTKGDDSGDNGGAAVAGVWRDSWVNVAFSGVGVPSWPQYTGGVSGPPRWGGNGGSEWV